MGKAKAKATQAKGKLKESVGGALDDTEMKAEGRVEQVKGKAEETAAKAADQVKKSGR